MAKSELKLLISSAFSCAAIALLALNLVYISIAPMALAIVFFALHARLERGNSSKLEKDALSFLERIAASKRRPFLKRIEESLQKHYQFYSDMAICIRRYALSSDANNSFKQLFQYRSECLSETVFLARNALESGTDVDRPLAQLVSKYSYKKELRLRNLGGVSNTSSIVSMGTIVFFPAFSGIGRDIMGMSVIGGSGASYAYTFVVLAYIAIIGAIASLYRNSDSLEKASSWIVMLAAGMFTYFITGSMGSLLI